MRGASAPSRRVYLDYAATAPFDPRLAGALEEAETGNANSLHAEGRAARAQLDDARGRIARALGAHEPTEIVFTSGGTESDNTAVHGLARKVPGAERTHVVVSAVEHDAVLEPARSLKAEGFKVDVVTPDASGVIVPATLEERLSRVEEEGDATCLVAVMWVNNELGTVEPVEELARVAHAHGALFFADAVQALGKLELRLEESGVDAASFSAHKVGGLKGTGALYLRRGVRLAPYLRGGGQESGLRSGTSNVLGAHVFAGAVERAQGEREALWERAEGFRAQILSACEAGCFAHAIAPTIPESSPHVPHILSLLAEGLEGETMVLRADDARIAVSSASACSTGSLEPSHVVTALGVPRQKAFGSLRVSFGYGTDEDDVRAFVDALPEVLR